MLVMYASSIAIAPQAGEPISMPAQPSETISVPIGAVLTPAEMVMRGVAPAPQTPTRPDRHLHKQVRFSIVISGSRCLLSYVVIPVLSPLVQPTLGHDPSMVIPLSVVALFFDARAIRSFWRSDHRWRRMVIAGYVLLIAGIALLLAHDIWRLAQ
jgi:hypothetical protein